ncbi:nucleotide-binding protein [Leifsonia sp. YAF41]|uniref:nucleotide-binding protein n=1 Tax=Leifsonia sp. YAF41 TaxID=3233086 RepID=UPI003F96F6A8
MSGDRSGHRVTLPSVFIGTSSEGLDIGRHLQQALEGTRACTVTRWDQGVFEASNYTMESLTKAAKQADFAVLIATADDTVESRGDLRAVARDNVIFELGLFIGALGRERTYIVADRTRDLQLPSDLQGLTWLPYEPREDGNQSAAVNNAVLGITARIRSLGPRTSFQSGSPSRESQDQRHALDIEIERVCSAARAQGWRVKTNSDTALRLQNRTGLRFTFPIGESAASRVAFRSFAAQLRANGLRISQSVRRPVGDAPLPR